MVKKITSSDSHRIVFAELTMSENRNYIPWVDVKFTTQNYNKLPLNYLNPFRLAFAYTDETFFKERAKYLTIHGCYFGLLPLTYAQTMKRVTESPNWTFLNKGQFLTSTAFNGIMGASSFFSYIAGVKLVDDLRGNPDDVVNHFFGGFFLSLPTAIYKRSASILLVYGFQLGILAAAGKYVYKNNYSLWNIDMDPRKVTPCRYPEFYMWTVGVPMPKEEERKVAKAYQYKDF